VRKRQKRILIIFVAAAILYVAVVAGVAFFSVENGKNLVLDSVDERLRAAASTLKYLLADDFHDRAIDSFSITVVEEMRNRQRMNAFTASTGFAWTYTLVERNGNFFFSAPTVTEKEAKEQERWYFHPYKDIPEGFRQAFKSGKTAFVSYQDQWGSYRSIAFPERSPGGRLYLSCIDIELKNLGALLRSQFINSLAASFFLLLAGFPFIFLYVGEIKAHNRLLEKMNERLGLDKSAAENRFRSLFDHSVDAVVVFNAEDQVSYVNPAFVSLFGWSMSELAGVSRPFIPPEFEREAAERLESLRKTGVAYRDYETRRITKDGTLLDVSMSGAPLFDGHGVINGSLFIYQDRTQRKRLEAQLAREEKYRAVATLAAGAAHDFNNALSVIQGNVSLLRMETTFNAEAAKLVQGIEDSVKSAAVLTDELLGFAHPDSSVRTRVDLGALCGQVSRSFVKTRPALRLFLNIPSEAVFAHVERNGLERVLLNLLVNADHAMNGEGELSISVSSKVLSSDQASRLSLENHEYGIVKISDSGIGMDEATLSRIFEPFYTTKKKGKGTGLGLASSYSMLRTFGGMIEAESEAGKGSVFTVFLPVADFTASSHPDTMQST